jgi:ElaA protein
VSAIHSPSAPGHRASGDIDWQVRSFDQIDGPALYQLLALRSQVFVVEQNCVFQDMDGFDAVALHLMGYTTQPEGQPVLQAYARCFAPGVKMPEASIGRVLTAQEARGTGMGHRLIAKALELVQQQWGATPIRIGAQMHLGAFYAQHGFVATGQPYMEDGIEHIEMLRA